MIIFVILLRIRNKNLRRKQILIIKLFFSLNHELIVTASDQNFNLLFLRNEFSYILRDDTFLWIKIISVNVGLDMKFLILFYFFEKNIIQTLKGYQSSSKWAFVWKRKSRVWAVKTGGADFNVRKSYRRRNSTNHRATRNSPPRGRRSS